MGLAMSETFAVNASTGASTHYTGYDFTGFCRGHDGRYYGIKADGLYLLDGKADAMIDFGDLDFGTSAEKRIAAAYGSYASPEPMNLHITEGEDTYDYPGRGVSETIEPHRFDTGKGLRSNYFGVAASNTDGAYFELDAVELAVVATSRRI